MVRYLSHGFVAFLPVFLAVWPVNAAEITPSHVFQSTEVLKAEIAAMHKTNFTIPAVSRNVPATRQPRHVLQKAREVFHKIQKLRQSRGGSITGLEPFPVKEIQPADVKALVDKSISELIALRASFGSKPGKSAAFVPDKTPTDVYKNLSDISESLDELGIPATSPGEVYHMATMMVRDIEWMLAKAGRETDNAMPDTAQNGSPFEVLQQVTMLHRKIAELTKKDGYAVPGGITVVTPPGNRVSPAVVLDAMNVVAADIAAIKAVMGITQTSPFTFSNIEKTPSEVYAVLKRGELLVDVLLKN